VGLALVITKRWLYRGRGEELRSSEYLRTY